MFLTTKINNESIKVSNSKCGKQDNVRLFITAASLNITRK